MSEPTNTKEHTDMPLEVSRAESTNIGDLEKYTSPPTGNLVYDNVDAEPVIHLRTWIALSSMFLMNFVQTFALQGPPSVLSYIGISLNNVQAETWVSASLTLMQAVISPLVSSASDTFQARKLLLVGTSTISFVGAAIAPGSTDLYRLIGATILIGVGFSSVGLAFAVPSEILPRKWRPMSQAVMNIAACLGAVAGPLVIGAFTEKDEVNGWKKFYWVQMALWGVTAIGIFFGYRPPKRHTRLDHLSFWQKLTHLDLPGFGLLTAGLTLFLVALNLGGGLFSWTNARVLSLLIIGLATLIGFGIYQWKGTKTGILHHELFQGGKEGGRTFAICIVLMMIEGIMLFSYVLFYPVMTSVLFEQDAFLLTVRGLPFWVVSGLSTALWGYWSMRFRTIRMPLFTGFLIYTAGLVGLATIQPGDDLRCLIFAGLAGLGFGGPLVLIVAGVQLSTPHHLIATATAVTTSARAVGATVFTAIFSAGFSADLTVKLPAGISSAVIQAGLAADNVPAFISAFTSQDTAALSAIPGVTSTIIEAATMAMKQAYADSLRVVYYIAIPFGVVACIACFFLADLRSTMNYRVDAPVENLTAKRHAAEK
ncbi:putative siderophore iron transporter [Xylariales sp. PMI_506]|nr:putative siderophore iron transporter [Xylariales sp. PMI_506]